MSETCPGLHIYTGDGKGKTTAAAGQALRAAAAGFRVLFIYFNKKRKAVYGEDKMLEKCGVRTEYYACSHPAFSKESSPGQQRKETLSGLSRVHKVFETGEFNMVIMDEIIVSVRDGFISESELIGLIDKRPAETDLVLTGRGATPGLIEKAALVSEIRKIKHPYDEGAKWRRGIEV